MGMLRYAVLVLVGVGLAKTCKCELPDAPMDRTEKVLLLADAGSRALDVYSTHQMLANGWQEIVLPRGLTAHTPVFAVYSGATVAADWWVARRLERHGHSKLAHVVTMVDIGQDAPWAIHNLFLGKREVFPAVPGRLTR